MEEEGEVVGVAGEVREGERMKRRRKGDKGGGGKRKEVKEAEEEEEGEEGEEEERECEGGTEQTTDDEARPSPSEKPPTHNYCIMEHAHTEEGEGLVSRLLFIAFISTTYIHR